MVLQHGHVVGVYVILLQILLIACQQRRKHTLSETRYDTLSTNLISFRPRQIQRYRTSGLSDERTWSETLAWATAKTLLQRASHLVAMAAIKEFFQNDGGPAHRALAACAPALQRSRGGSFAPATARTRTTELGPANL